MDFFKRISARIKDLSNAKSQKAATPETPEAKSEILTLKQFLNYLGVSGVASSELASATYFACLKVLSEAVGKLPFKIHQNGTDGGIRIAREHPYYKMINARPNRYTTASAFWTTMELWRHHYGNAYAWIDDSDVRHPQLWQLNPQKVRLLYDNSKCLSDQPDIYYTYTTPNGVKIFKSEEVLHFKSHFTLNGIIGISVAEQLADTLAGNVAAHAMLNKLYKNGMTAKAVLQYTGDLDPAKRQLLKKQLATFAKQELSDETWLDDIIPLPDSVSLTPLNLKLADSQFVELTQFSALQIASAFGVKPYQIGDYTKSSYSSAEAQQLSFLVDTLMHNLKTIEEEVSYKLLTDKEAESGYEARFNAAAMLRTDQQTKITTLSTAVNSFLMTPNEARRMLDLPDVVGGDRLLGNGASIPVDQTGNQYKN